jgi:hypothetical protein
MDKENKVENKTIKLDEELKKEIIKLIENVEEKDSIEIGTPGKSGVVKVYCNFSKPVEAKVKISNAIDILKEKRIEVFQ